LEEHKRVARVLGRPPREKREVRPKFFSKPPNHSKFSTVERKGSDALPSVNQKSLCPLPFLAVAGCPKEKSSLHNLKLRGGAAEKKEKDHSSRFEMKGLLLF